VGGVGAAPSGITFSRGGRGYDSLKDRMEGPPLPVTLRFDPGDDDPPPKMTQGIMTPPPKMTQGVMTPPTPPSSPSTASLSGVARCWHSNAYFSLCSSLFFFDPPNRFVQIPRDLS
jgi:hypothetical protein